MKQETNKSACCNAEIKIQGGDPVCAKCHDDCDTIEEPRLVWGNEIKSELKKLEKSAEKTMPIISTKCILVRAFYLNSNTTHRDILINDSNTLLDLAKTILGSIDIDNSGAFGFTQKLFPSSSKRVYLHTLADISKNGEIPKEALNEIKRLPEIYDYSDQAKRKSVAITKIKNIPFFQAPGDKIYFIINSSLKFEISYLEAKDANISAPQIIKSAGSIFTPRAKWFDVGVLTDVKLHSDDGGVFYVFKGNALSVSELMKSNDGKTACFTAMTREGDLKKIKDFELSSVDLGYSGTGREIDVSQEKLGTMFSTPYTPQALIQTWTKYYGYKAEVLRATAVENKKLYDFVKQEFTNGKAERTYNVADVCSEISLEPLDDKFLFLDAEGVIICLWMWLHPETKMARFFTQKDFENMEKNDGWWTNAIEGGDFQIKKEDCTMCFKIPKNSDQEKLDKFIATEESVLSNS